MTVLIYDTSNSIHEQNVIILEFKTETELIDFINKNKLNKKDILAMYKVSGKLEIQPLEVVTKYIIKD